MAGRLTRWGLRGGMSLTALLGAGALHYSTIEPHWLGALAAIGFALILAIAAMHLRPSAVVWGIAMAALLAWYIQDSPSNHRDWAPEYAVLAASSQDGRRVSVQHIRNFTYRSEADFTPGYYDRVYSLDDLTTVDLITSYWAGDVIAHVFLTFGFRDGRHLAFSIETRRQRHAAYSTIAGFFHYYELFYVVADERDLIGVRTDIRHERVYLYRVYVSPSVREALFLSYLAKLRQLAGQPEWYNTLTDNCTTGILARADAPGHIRRDWRVLLSGYAAEYAYSRGLLHPADSFAELRRESLIVRAPTVTIDDTYSADIRRGLPLIPGG